MVRLNLSNAPRWITLLDPDDASRFGVEAVEVLVEPVTTAVMQAIRAEVRGNLDIEPEAEVEDSAALQLEFHKVLAGRIIHDWRGVHDENGDPAKVTPETAAALMDLLLIYEAWVLKVFSPFIGLATEKNGSALSPSGTSAGATNTARPARANAKSARPASTRRKR